MKLRYTTLLACAGLQFVCASVLADAETLTLRFSDGLQELPELPANWNSPARISEAVQSAGSPGFTTGPFEAGQKARPGLPPTQRSLSRLFDISFVPIATTLDAGSFRDGTQVADSINLGDSLRLAVEFSRDVRMAGTRLEAARAQTGQSVSLLLPSLNWRVAHGREVSSPASVKDPETGLPKFVDGHNRSDKTIVLKQPVVDLPGIFEVIRRKDLERSREFNVVSSEGEAALSAVQAYLGLVSTRLQADLALEFEQQLKELLEYLRKRADAGASTVSDLDRVRARVLTAYATRIEQEAAHAAAGVEFVRLVNVLPKRIRLPDMRELGSIPPNFDDAVAQAFQLNPDLGSLQSEIDAAQTDRSAAKTTFLPRLDIELSEFRVNNAGGETGLQHDKRYMLVANWALFEGGRSVRLLEERTARREETLLRLDDTRRRLVQTLSAQYALLSSVRERIYSGYAELDALKAALSAVSERLLSANQSLLDVLDVYDRVYQVRVRLVNLHVQEFTAASQIIRNIYGRSSESPGPASGEQPSQNRTGN